MSLHPNESRPAGTEYENFSLEFMWRIKHVCYTPGQMSVLREMTVITTWKNRYFSRGRDYLVQQTHLEKGSVSTFIQVAVRDGLLKELINRGEVFSEKHRQNYAFLLPEKVILDCRNWFPHAASKEHSSKRAEQFAYKYPQRPAGEIIQLGDAPEVTDPWEDFQSPDGRF